MRNIKSTSVPLLYVVITRGVGCGGDTVASPTPAVTDRETRTPVSTTSTPTPQPTTPALAVEAPEVQQVLALAGFREFAAEFEAAVESNDTQFFIDRGYLHPVACGGGGIGSIPCPSGATNVSVDAILVGAWNSDGGYYARDQYDDLITNYLSNEIASNATMHALGHEKRFADETEMGADIVVSGVAFPVPSGQPENPDFSLNFQVQAIDGVWRITSLDLAFATLVPDFFDWYALWDDAFGAP